MTEPILAAEVLAEEWQDLEESVIYDEAAGPESVLGIAADHAAESAVEILLALFPEGDVVIRRDGSVAGLEPMRPADACRCAHDHWSACTTGQGCPCLTEPLARLVPLSREAE